MRIGRGPGIEYEQAGFEGLYLGRSTAAVDDRGSIARVFDGAALQAAGGPALSWVELNESRSRRATIRGLHFRLDLRQWKQIRVIRGAIVDVVVDLRPASPTYRRTFTVELAGSDTQQVIVPPGFAHGFQALADETDVSFTSSVAADPSLEGGFRFDDTSVAIPWPLSPPIVSRRDATLPPLDAVTHDLASAFRGP